MLNDSKDKSRGAGRREREGASVEVKGTWGRYRRRRIDAVIDYFGEMSESARAGSGRERAGTILSTDGPFAETKG
jgi:hypothetical protein